MASPLANGNHTSTTRASWRAEDDATASRSHALKRDLTWGLGTLRHKSRATHTDPLQRARRAGFLPAAEASPGLSMASPGPAPPQ
eukprot:1654672-Alexandrium_andersonii.AAC.1